MLIIAGTITLDPAKRSEAERAFDRVREATLKEPGCRGYQAYFDRGDQGVLFLFEKWDGPEALASHFKTPHMAEFMTAMGGLGVTGMDIKRYEVSSEGPMM